MHRRLSSSLRIALLAPALATAALVACNTRSGSPPSIEQASYDLATAYCGALGACSPFSLQIRYLDTGSCVNETSAEASAGARAPETGVTPAALEACAQAYAMITCAALESRAPPAACAFHGTVADGAGCALDSQCGSGRRCSMADGATCGTCTPDLLAGASCGNSTVPCATGLECALSGVSTIGDGGATAPTATCVAIGTAAEGAACGPAVDMTCGAPLACVQGTCAAPLELGAACDPLADACDPQPGLTCDATSKTCVKEVVAAPGAPCGLLNGVVTLCGGYGASCTPGATAGAPSTCVPAVAIGKPCDAATEFCEATSSCVGGVCTVAEPATCH